MVLAAETVIFSSIFGRTDLIIGAFKAKKCEGFDFEIRLPVRPPKLAQKGETRYRDPKNSLQFFFSPKIEMSGIV